MVASVAAHLLSLHQRALSETAAWERLPPWPARIFLPLESSEALFLSKQRPPPVQATTPARLSAPGTSKETGYSKHSEERQREAAEDSRGRSIKNPPGVPPSASQAARQTEHIGRALSPEP